MNKFLLSFLVFFTFTTPVKSDLSSQYSSLDEVVKMCKENTSEKRTIWITNRDSQGREMSEEGVIISNNQVYFVPINRHVNGVTHPNCDSLWRIGGLGKQETVSDVHSIFGVRCHYYCERLFKLEDQNGSKVLNYYHKNRNSSVVQKVTFK